MGVDSGATDGGAKVPLAVYQLAGFSAIGGFLFGYDTGVVSGAMILIREQFELSTIWQELIVSATIAAAWLAALVAGPATDRFGRRNVILCASVVFTVGAVVMGTAPEKFTLLVGRIIVGIGIGFASMSVPVYLSESSPMKLRGHLTVTYNLLIAFGQMIAAIICGAFSTVPQGWRYMLGLAGVPGVIQLAGFTFMPESPRWLVARGRIAEAHDVLMKIRSEDDDVEMELEAMKAAVLEDNNQNNKGGLLQVLKSVPVRRALLLGSLLQLFQQICGINTVIICIMSNIFYYFSGTTVRSIITMAGVTNESLAIWLSAATASVNCISGLLGLWLVERIGRRPLTIASLAGVMASLFMLAITFQMAYIHSPDVTSMDPSSHQCNDESCGVCTSRGACGFCFMGDTDGQYNATCVLADHDEYNEMSVSGLCANSTLLDTGTVTFAYDWCPYKYAWLSICGLALYLFCFAPGMGPMPWTLNSEIYPIWARATCTSITTAVNWAANLLISLTFLTLTEVLLKHGAFYLYMVLSGVGCVVFFFLLPETRGVPLEEMEDLFSAPLLARRNRRK